MSLIGGLSQSPETTQAVRGLVTSRLRGSPTAHKSAFGETWRGWPRKRPDELEGPRLALWGPDALTCLICSMLESTSWFEAVTNFSCMGTKRCHRGGGDRPRLLEQHTAAGPQGALRKSRPGASRHRAAR